MYAPFIDIMSTIQVIGRAPRHRLSNMAYIKKYKKCLPIFKPCKFSLRSNGLIFH
jgi:hypothetical protein